MFRFSEGVRTGMAVETRGEPQTASYEDLVFLLLLLDVNGQWMFYDDSTSQNILVVGQASIDGLLDQIFGHTLGLLEQLWCHLERRRGKDLDEEMFDGLIVVG
jgi:hypothetical protein